MEWYRNFFRKPCRSSHKNRLNELTEFELSESHKILLNTENIVEELLQHISEQQQLIGRYEAELDFLRSGYVSAKGNTKIIEEGSIYVS